MTAREKLKADLKNSEMLDKFIEVLIENCCPSEFDYLKDPGDCGTSVTKCCLACWNREIPGSGLIVGDEKIEHPDTDIPKEEFDYKAECNKLRKNVEYQKQIIDDLNKVREKQQKEIEYWCDLAEKYELVIKAVEAVLGRQIISTNQDDDDYEE